MRNLKYINILNIISCISVIALHCNGCFWQFADAMYWKTSVVIETLFYTAVPCFFMIIGVTLIDYTKKYNTSVFFKKRFVKTFYPFIFWSLFAIVFQCLRHPERLASLDLTQLTNSVVMTKAMPVYWFFIPLFAVYLSIPVLNKIPDIHRKATYTYMIYCSLLSTSVLPMAFKVLKLEYNYELAIPIAGGYIMYLLLGYLLEYCYELSSKQRYIVYIAGLLGLLVRMVTVYVWSLEEGKINNTMGGYTNLPTIAYSMAVFVFVKYELMRTNYIQKMNAAALQRISGYSFGVYLLHMYFVIGLPKILHFANTSIWWRTIGVLVVYCCCLLVVHIMKKLPVLKNSVP